MGNNKDKITKKTIEKDSVNDKPYDFFDIASGLRKKQEDYDNNVKGGVNVNGHLKGLRNLFK